MTSTAAAADGDLAARVRAAQLPPPGIRRRIRSRAGVTLRQMAVELQVSPMTVLRWEQGGTVPRLDHAVAYRRLLDDLDAAAAPTG